MPREDSLSLGIAFIPGGAMEIVLGMLALELGLIPENVFVAIVFAALLSSVMVGPLLAWSIKRRRAIDICDFLSPDTIVSDLKGASRWEAIAELCERIAAHSPALDNETIVAAVRRREEIMGTGLERGLAVPHARLAGIQRPLVAFGRSRAGIDWDASDGLATHFVFLVLTPAGEEGAQVQILASIARCIGQPDVQSRVMAADDPAGMHRTLSGGLRKQNEPRRN
jgi:mannitol/fructose-specific phosphotransferase system IIA component (Ntr-type)